MTAIENMTAYLTGAGATSEKINIMSAIQQCKLYAKQEAEQNHKPVCLDLQPPSYVRVNDFCVSKMGAEVMDKTQAERDHLYHYYKVMEYISTHNVNLKFEQ